MASFLRRWIHQFIPSHFHDPIGLTRRLLRTGDPAALFAMKSALLGLAAAPLDIALRPLERRRYRNAPAPVRPMVIVCGPARSGTTLVAQVLIEQLDLAYVNNLTAVFPRSPLTANRLFHPDRMAGSAAYRSYYGRTAGFAGPNDGLHLWDRWLGRDRTKIPVSLTPEAHRAMRAFFGAMEQHYGTPVLAKNNSLYACAGAVAQALEHAVFLCLRRDPAYLAQSQLQARLQIHGRDDVPYGLPGPPPMPGADVIEDICRQVLHHESLAQEQQQRLGSDRFRIVSYEAFCADPTALVEQMAGRIGVPRSPRAAPLMPFTASTRVQFSPERFTQIVATLKRLGPLMSRPEG